MCCELCLGRCRHRRVAAGLARPRRHESTPGKARVGAGLRNAEGVSRQRSFLTQRRTHDQEADHRRRRDACKLLAIGFGAFFHEVDRVLYKLLEGLNYYRVDVRHGPLVAGSLLRAISGDSLGLRSYALMRTALRYTSYSETLKQRYGCSIAQTAAATSATAAQVS